MFRSFENHFPSVEVVPCMVDEKDKPLVECVAVVDQLPAQDFNVNECGWLRNDISALSRAQTKQEYEMIAQRLKENQAVYDVKDGTKIKDAVRMIRPRFAQTPYELENFASAVANGDVAALKEKVAKKSIKSDVPDVAPSPSPAPAPAAE